MTRMVRKVGIGAGSLVAACSAVGFPSGWILPWFGVTSSRSSWAASPTGTSAAAINVCAGSMTGCAASGDDA